MTKTLKAMLADMERTREWIRDPSGFKVEHDVPAMLDDIDTLARALQLACRQGGFNDPVLDPDYFIAMAQEATNDND